MKEPKHYTSAAVLAVHAYGLLLVVPVVAAIALLSLYIAEWSLAVPFIAMAVTAFILPFGLGNPHVCRLVRSFCPQATRGEGFVVQVTYQPRKRSGVRGLLEDADDVGWLSFTDKAAVFEGDASRFVIPYEKIKEIHRQNVGLRGLYLYGRRLELKIQGMPGAESVLIAERSSWILPGSRRNMRSLWQQAAARVASSREANPARG